MKPTMRILLSYDRGIDAWTITHENVSIESLEDIERWRKLLVDQLDRLGGKKVFLLLDISGFHLDARMAKHYGPIAQSVIKTYALGLIRYGAKDAETVASVTQQAIINRFPANVFRDRAEALEALKRIRAQAA